MKKTYLVLIAAVWFLSYTPAQAYWIWTPKTGKWINPKTSVKANPKEQLAYSKEFYDLKKYDEAIREFKKLVKAYPKAAEAAEAQYYIGLCEESRDNLWDAYQAYQKVVDKYPFSERIGEINEREFKIAEEFMGGSKRKAMGIVLPVENPALEIFAKVVENSTYGPLAPKAQYKLGLLYKSLSRFYEAEEAFSKVVSNYPDSEWASASEYQIASCRSAVSRGPDYDQGATKEAKDKFEQFVREHPDATLSEEAEKHVDQLKEKEAESTFLVGRFYEKQKQFKSARIYYQDIITNHPKSIWSIKALERLRILEKGNK